MKYWLLSGFILFSLFASAQEDSIHRKNIDEVVVTGQFTPQSLRKSVYQVKTISGTQIHGRGTTNLEDVLKTELNIRFSQDIATGGSNISMSGLKGQNVKILLDGVPVIGRQGINNEININQIDIQTIEKIEIVEGPMSVVYGADALAGVINIITKKPKKEKLSIQAKLHEETVGNEYGTDKGIHNQSIGISGTIKNFKLGGNLSHNFFGGFKGDSTGNELTWHKKDQILAGAFLGFSKNNWDVHYRFDGLDEIITNPGNFVNYNFAAADTFAFQQEYFSDRMMHQVQANYDPKSNWSLQTQASFTNYSRQVYSSNISKRSGKETQSSIDQSLDKFNNISFRTTVPFTINKQISLMPGIDINMDKGSGDRLEKGENHIEDYAAFLTAEIQPNSKINIRPGLRWIKNSVYKAPPIVPSINTKFVLNENLDFRLAYAQGFRAPSIRELYFNFFDATHQIVGNKDLKAETSNSFTGSLTWKKSDPGKLIYSTMLSGYYNKVNNMIDYAPSVSNPSIYILTNVFQSKSVGASLSTIAKYQSWNMTVGAGYTGFHNDYYSVDKSLRQLQWSPEANANLGYSIQKAGLDFNLFYKFTGRKPFYFIDNQGYVLSHQKAYNMADFSANKQLGKLLKLQLGVNNLFNVKTVNSEITLTGVHTGNGSMNVATGRSYFAALTFNWNK